MSTVSWRWIFFINLPVGEGALATGLGPISPADRAHAASSLAHAFGSTFWVALALITVALVPALLLPRRR